jgi:hypothetical protein
MFPIDIAAAAPPPSGVAGTFPQDLDSVTAAILARLLEGEELTPMDSVFRDGTTRLGAFIYTLTHNRNWDFEFRDVAIATKDGRIARVRAFRFALATIQAALAVGAADWIVKVKQARARLREKAVALKVVAAKKNVVKRWKPHGDPRQLKFWGDV